MEKQLCYYKLWLKIYLFKSIITLTWMLKIQCCALIIIMSCVLALRNKKPLQLINTSINTFFGEFRTLLKEYRRTRKATEG